MFDLEKQSFLVSRDVISMTEAAPMGSPATSFVKEDAPQTTSTETMTPRCSQEHTCDGENDAPMTETNHDHELSAETEISTPPPTVDSGVGESANNNDAGKESDVREGSNIMPQGIPDAELGKGKRQRKAPAYLNDYQTGLVCSKATVKYPIGEVLSDERFSLSHKCFLTAITTEKIPKSFEEAMHDPRWREAMQREIDALELNETWSLESLPTSKKALGCKWIFTIKYHSDGSIERYKARLVVLGNRQIEGTDYAEKRLHLLPR